MTDVADVFGQDTERRVALTGWIGEHPVDGSDVAHLLIYPVGHGVAAKMRTLADVLGLASARSGAMTDVPPDTTWIAVSDGDVGIHCGDSAWLRRPITADWVEVARRCGWVILTVGSDGYTGRAADLETYLARGSRLYMGRIRAVANEGDADE